MRRIKHTRRITGNPAGNARQRRKARRLFKRAIRAAERRYFAEHVG